MADDAPVKPEPFHRFLDETGDTTFYGKGRKLIIGTNGVSLSFGLGVVRIDRPLEEVRREVRALEGQVEADALLNTIPSVERQHHGREEVLYADVLAHLIKNRLKRAGTLVLNVAERGSSTREKVLTGALKLASERAARRWGAENLKARVVFNVQNPRTEPLLTVSDYLCWAVQRVFETGEMRHYNYLAEKIRLVVDLYDRDKYARNRNYYGKKNPLTPGNKLGPPVA